MVYASGSGLDFETPSLALAVCVRVLGCSAFTGACILGVVLCVCVCMRESWHVGVCELDC